MAESSPPQLPIGRTASRGIRVLFGRQGICQIISLVGGILLARLLEPADFAVFGVCLFFQQSFSRFSNMGLCAGLVRQESEPTERELRVGFTAQLLAVSLASCVAMIAGPLFLTLYPDIEFVPACVVLETLVVSLWIGSLSAIPRMTLERDLNFSKLGLIDVLASATYFSIAVVASICGAGVYSFALAVLVRAFLVAALAHRLTQFRPRFAWDTPFVKGLLRFGVPLQGMGIMNQLAIGVPALVIAPAVGPTQFGILIWATNFGMKLKFLSSPMMQVAFPHLCRLQNTPSFYRVYEKYLVFVSSVVGYWLVVAASLGESIIVPIYGEKWMAGLFAGCLYAVAASLAVADDMAVGALKVLGRTGRGFLWAAARCGCLFVIATLLTPKLEIAAAPVSLILLSLLASITLSPMIDRAVLYLTIKALGVISLSMVISYGLVILTFEKSGSGVPESLIALALGSAAYVFVIFLFNSEILSEVYKSELQPTTERLRTALRPLLSVARK